ncbi:hypothetical protein GKZ89_20640 [Bacillus mangrovi]|uniref:Uncharacterized protein n=1 Tax=Metabacillus mangrovi TaxID=1491830 RepID=A0A7X2V7A6_9BACI|nr:hypothetical protein [Metabacillus mangrovi]MTH55799.1 hypothetical protein [Metabacillus mangrovi]
MKEAFSKGSLVIPLSETVLVVLIHVADSFSESDRGQLIEQTDLLIQSCSR